MRPYIAPAVGVGKRGVPPYAPTSCWGRGDWNGGWGQPESIGFADVGSLPNAPSWSVTSVLHLLDRRMRRER